MLWRRLIGGGGGHGARDESKWDGIAAEEGHALPVSRLLCCVQAYAHQTAQVSFAVPCATPEAHTSHYGTHCTSCHSLITPPRCVHLLCCVLRRRRVWGPSRDGVRTRIRASACDGLRCFVNADEWHCS